MKLNYTVDLHKDEEKEKKVSPKTRLSMQATAEQALMKRTPASDPGQMATAGDVPGQGW